ARHRRSPRSWLLPPPTIAFAARPTSKPDLRIADVSQPPCSRVACTEYEETSCELVTVISGRFLSHVSPSQRVAQLLFWGIGRLSENGHSWCDSSGRCHRTRAPACSGARREMTRTPSEGGETQAPSRRPRRRGSPRRGRWSERLSFNCGRTELQGKNGKNDPRYRD